MRSGARIRGEHLDFEQTIRAADLSDEDRAVVVVASSVAIESPEFSREGAVSSAWASTLPVIS